jgi:hypothetical protein
MTTTVDDRAGERPVPARRVLDVAVPGSTFGIGSLPHLSARQAARFAFEGFDIPTVPSLPRRSPAELGVAQALLGVPGVSLGQYGAVAVDPSQFDPDAHVTTDLDGGQFIGLRAFLDEAVRRGHDGPVKWQFMGPISVGTALMRAGAGRDVAFAIGLRAVRSHLTAIQGLIAGTLPSCPQLVLLDEPFAHGLVEHDFPIAPDDAIDLVSGAMAALEASATVGIHSCKGTDPTTLLAAGPHVMSLPVSRGLVAVAGYLDRFVRNDGWIAWGAVATEGPIGAGRPRAWQRLATVICELVQAGCDRDRLLSQCFITPECGLGTHSRATAQQVAEALSATSLTMRSETSTARFVLGG